MVFLLAETIQKPADLPHVKQGLADLPGGGVGVGHPVQEACPLPRCLLPLHPLLHGVDGGQLSGGQLYEVLVAPAAADTTRVGAEIFLEEKDDASPTHSHHKYHRTLEKVRFYLYIM